MYYTNELTQIYILQFNNFVNKCVEEINFKHFSNVCFMFN